MAAQPSPAVPSAASHDPPGPVPRSQQPANSQKATAAPTHGSAQATGAQLAEKLRGFAKGAMLGISRANNELVANRFAGDVATITAAAKRGDAQAQLHMIGRSYVKGCRDEQMKWSRAAIAQGNADAILWMGLGNLKPYLDTEKDGPERDMLKNIALGFLQDPADHGSARVQYAIGMLLYCSQCESGDKAGLLDAAIWIRKAAMQGLMDAQYELGEMFRHGVFCDHIYVCFARKYIRRASVQGHAEAIARMQELRSCVLCGAFAAKLACSTCHQVRYCDSRCSEKHLCEGGGVGGGVSGGAGARHKDMCPRTHAR